MLQLKKGLLGLIGAGALCSAGCVHHHHGHRGPVHTPRPVTKVHVHKTGCGHVYVNGRWIVKVTPKPRIEVHVHGVGCGHVQVNGKWVIRAETKPPLALHVHGDGCGHVRVNGVWVLPSPAPQSAPQPTPRVVTKPHPHGAPPGQTKKASQPRVVTKPAHPHGTPPGQAKKVVVTPQVHVHGDGCGHVKVDGVWVVVKTSEKTHPKGTPPGQSKKKAHAKPWK